MNELNSNFAETIKDVSVAAMEPRSFGTGQPFVIIPKDYRSEDLEQLMTAPVRKRGQVITSNTLAVRFKHGGTLYHYQGVSAEKFEQFKTSESIGSFLGKNIKGHHDFTKIIEKKE